MLWRRFQFDQTERGAGVSQPPSLSVAPAAHLEFDDNRLLPMLFGEYDQNLARIEQLSMPSW